MKKIAESLRSHIPRSSFFLLAALTILVPFIVLPLTDGFLLDSKSTFVLVVGFLCFLLWAVAAFVRKSIQITLSPFLLPSLLLIGVVLVSSFLNSPYPITHLLGWGGIYIALFSILLFGSSLLGERKNNIFLNLLLVPSLFLSLAAFAELIGFGPSRIFNLLLKAQFPSSPLFNLSGSPIITVEFLGLVLVGLLATLFINKKKFSPLYTLVTIIIAGGILINGYSVYQLQKATPLFLPFTASGSIALDGLKSLKTALFGFGPENYNHAYMAFKPVWLNTTPFFSMVFTQASDFPFTLLTTLGILGLAAWLFLVFQVVQRWRQKAPASTAAAAVFLAALVIEVIFPVNVVILTIQTLALVFWIAAERNMLKDIQLHAFTVQLIKSGEETQRIPKHTHLIVYTITLINVLLLGIIGYWLGRSTIAEYYAFRASIASAHSNVLSVYDFQQKASQLNPYSDLYRRNYSLTNLSIAAALSGNSDKTKIDKNKVLTLVQQSIQEAKAATQIDPLSSLDWLTLARVYANLIGVADQADQWSIAAYSQAVALAPNDPSLNLELGTIYFNTNKVDQAIQVFQHTVQLKPDWPNAYYALARAYRQKGQTADAIAMYQQTLSLLNKTPNNSQSYAAVKTELDTLQAQSNQPKAKTSATQVTPTTGANSLSSPVPTGTSSAALKKVKDIFKGTNLTNP